MNKRLVITTALSVAAMALSQAQAGEKELRKHEVPKAVVEAFEKAYPTTKGVEYEQEIFDGKVAYEVEYKEKGKEYEVLYDANGMVLQKEETIDVKSLPEPVVQAIMKAHPKAKVKEAEKVTKPDGTITGYEVEIKAGGKEFELELDTSGTILKSEQD
jgi:uncharacterized membrane protein YkoI